MEKSNCTCSRQSFPFCYLTSQGLQTKKRDSYQLEEDLGKIFDIQIHNLVLKCQRKKKPNDKWKS